MTWIERIAGHSAKCGRVVRVSVIRTDGSVPREVGASMMVSDTLLDGTIGGGALEFEAIARARYLLDDARPDHSAWQRQVKHYPLGPSLGQCCGGHVRLLFEVLGDRELSEIRPTVDCTMAASTLIIRPIKGGSPMQIVPGNCDRSASPAAWPNALERVVRDMRSGARPTEAVLVRSPATGSDWFVEPLMRRASQLFIYGAGHVGRSVVRVLEGLRFDITWIDTHRLRFPEALRPGVRMVVAGDPTVIAGCAPPGTFHLVLTYSHALDLAICSRLMEGAAFGYLGLIGSASKRSRFIKRLAEAGVPQPSLSRLVCPIGMDGITGKEPNIIAVSVVADLLRRLSEMDTVPIHEHVQNVSAF